MGLRFFPPFLQPFAELEDQAEEISGKETEGGEAAWPRDEVTPLDCTFIKKHNLNCVLENQKTSLLCFFSLGLDVGEESNSDEEQEKKKEVDEDEETERKLAELKAKEVAELKRYNNLSWHLAYNAFLFMFWLLKNSRILQMSHPSLNNFNWLH